MLGLAAGEALLFLNHIVYNACILAYGTPFDADAVPGSLVPALLWLLLLLCLAPGLMQDVVTAPSGYGGQHCRQL
jgi:hypothetical protein